MAAATIERPVYEVKATDLTLETVRVSPQIKRALRFDLAALRFLRQLVVYRDSLVFSDRTTNTWLLPFRKDFRHLISGTPDKGIQKFLEERPPDSPCYALAVSLLGRCSDRYETYCLENVPADHDPQSRRHFARALRRTESWPRLARLAGKFPSDKFIARMLYAPHRGKFQHRLERFIEHVDKSHAAEATLAPRMPLWQRDAEWEETPPKSASWMRCVLQRIRQWVRGEVVP
ncbi:MAG: hypothetical protein ACR2NU_05795 [Aeoliella sp.]